MTVPEGFTLEPVDAIIPTTPEEPQDYTAVMIPLTVEQYSFMTTTVTSEPNQAEDSWLHAMPHIGFRWDAVGHKRVLQRRVVHSTGLHFQVSTGSRSHIEFNNLSYRYI